MCTTQGVEALPSFLLHFCRHPYDLHHMDYKALLYTAFSQMERGPLLQGASLFEKGLYHIKWQAVRQSHRRGMDGSHILAIERIPCYNM